MNVKFLIMKGIFIVFLMTQATAQQGFAGLGRVVDSFSQPEPGYVFDFPRDHGAHTDFQIEWWYLTANLTDATGRDLGVQWTLFRSAFEPLERDSWDSPQLWMGHAAVTTPTAHHVAERFARGGIGQAGVTAAPFMAWIDEWNMAGETMDRLDLRAGGKDFSYDLTLSAQGPLIFHGADGYSQKSSSGRASHYYSQPFFEVSGRLKLPEGELDVTGTAWLDREWASQPLDATQTSWDWFAMLFDSGARLMAAQVHDSTGGTFMLATWIEPDGQAAALTQGALTLTPLAHSQVAGRSVPIRWRVVVPEKKLDVQVEAINPMSWMETSVPYWEGPTRIGGSHMGRGYLEMTGY